MPFSVAMDGPVGAGKSSVADAVAARLGILHLDTGAMYRAVGLTALRRGINPGDELAVSAMCAGLTVDVRYSPEGQRTLVDGEDVTGAIRTEEVSMAASTVARYPAVRSAMVEAQRRLSRETDMLVDGRDICTVVLPHADVKIYLTASPEERARRRYQQLLEKGDSQSTYAQVLEDLRRRDAQDMGRSVDPLRPAEDAVIVDTTDCDFEESVQRVVDLVRRRRNE